MDDQSEIIAFLSRPEAYGPGCKSVERHATHGSVVFLAGADAYKLKRAVRYSYMDYAAPDRRRAMCEAELAVNRRLAPQLYLAVRPVMRDGKGALRIGEVGESAGAVDWLVQMRRFESTLLESLQGGLDLATPVVRELAERIAAFHQSADRSAAFGGAAGIARVIDENSDTMGQMIAAPFDRQKVGRLEELARGALQEIRPLLEARRESGRVRRCHGDLHLNNICMIDGHPVLFDAIEFSEDFACIDVLFDLAFLLMDMDRHGRRAQANVLLNRYLEQTEDYAGLAALPLFLSCRAAIKAHVTITAARLDKKGASPARALEAADLLDRAIAYLEPEPIRLVAVGGPSGTGKSTLAAELAPLLGRAPGAIVLRSDVMRKHLWGVDDCTRLPSTAYQAKFTDRVYTAISQRAAVVLESGYCVIADAVFGRKPQRADIAALAYEARAPFQGLWLDAPLPLLERRLAERRNDASDATPQILQAQLAEIDTPIDWTAIDASGSPASLHTQASKALGLAS